RLPLGTEALQAEGPRSTRARNPAVNLRCHADARAHWTRCDAGLGGNRPRAHLFDRRTRQYLTQPLDRACVQLRNARFVDADLAPDLLHGRFLEVVEAQDVAFARGQLCQRRAHAAARLSSLEPPG